MTGTEREDRLALADLPKPETMLTYASILEKPQYVVKDNIRYPIATGEIIEAACAALRYCAALRLSPVMDGMQEALAALDLAHSVLPNGSVRSKIWKASTDLKAALSASHPQARGEEELERLREWKSSILGICKTCDGFDSLKWGGDKEGWGFVFYFIQHLNTRALHAETVLAEQDAARPSEATTGREVIASAFAKQFPAVLAQYSQFKIVDWFLSLPASHNGVDTNRPNTKPQSPVGHYTGRPIT